MIWRLSFLVIGYCFGEQITDIHAKTYWGVVQIEKWNKFKNLKSWPYQGHFISLFQYKLSLLLRTRGGGTVVERETQKELLSILCWFSSSILYSQLSASCYYASCACEHLLGNNSLQHFLCWSIFRDHNRLKSHVASCVLAYCVSLFYPKGQEPTPDSNKRTTPFLSS